MTAPQNGVFLDQYYNLHYPPGAKFVDGATDDVLAMADEHWYQFPPVHPLIQHLTGLIFFVLWFISTVGNGLVIFIFLKTKTLRTPSNILVVALALSDLLMINVNAPPLFINMFMSRYWAFGVFACELYGFLGGVFGVASLWLIIMIGYDRYNVIVKGFNGVKITPAITFLMLLWSYGYSTLNSLPPLLKWWGSFKLEGLLLTCSFDYLTDTVDNMSFTACYFTGCFVIPFLCIAFFYSQIVVAVVSHERALKAQAKKMNVESLRSNENKDADSAEIRIAKVAITNVCIWLLAWCPYAAVAMMGQFGGKSLLTPVATQLPSFFAKTASCMNPIVFAISHPKYREALATEIPCFGIREAKAEDKSDTKTTTVQAA